MNRNKISLIIQLQKVHLLHQPGKQAKHLLLTGEYRSERSPGVNLTTVSLVFYKEFYLPIMYMYVIVTRFDNCMSILERNCMPAQKRLLIIYPKYMHAYSS